MGHLDQAQKRAMIADQLRDTPEQSNRQIAAGLGVSHHTVAAAREALVDGGQIAHQQSIVGRDGVKQPASKPARKVTYVDDSAAGLACVTGDLQASFQAIIVVKITKLRLD